MADSSIIYYCTVNDYSGYPLPGYAIGGYIEKLVYGLSGPAIYYQITDYNGTARIVLKGTPGQLVSIKIFAFDQNDRSQCTWFYESITVSSTSMSKELTLTIPETELSGTSLLTDIIGSNVVPQISTDLTNWSSTIFKIYPFTNVYYKISAPDNKYISNYTNLGPRAYSNSSSVLRNIPFTVDSVEPFYFYNWFDNEISSLSLLNIGITNDVSLHDGVVVIKENGHWISGTDHYKLYKNNNGTMTEFKCENWGPGNLTEIIEDNHYINTEN